MKVAVRFEDGLVTPLTVSATMIPPPTIPAFALPLR
jgi:hypothetical protein